MGNYSNSACERIQSLEPFYATQYYAYEDSDNQNDYYANSYDDYQLGQIIVKIIRQN